MKRLFFIIGITSIFILAMVLLFLLLASDTQKKQIFNTFNFGGSSLEEGTIEQIIDAIIPGNEVNELAALRQLTIKQVIGAIEITPTASSSNTLVSYAEAGTGHIYNLNIQTAVEERISNITVPTAQKAVFSKSGKYAAVATDVTGEGRSLTLVTLPGTEDELSSRKISELIQEFTITSDDKLLYTTVVNDVLTARTYNPLTSETKTLFTLPFKEATVRFGIKSTDSAYVYPQVANSLEGYVYEVNGGILQRLPISGFGLSVIAQNNTLLYSLTIDDTLTSSIYTVTTKSSNPLPLPVFPEKCALISLSNTLFCGITTDPAIHNLENWYKGVGVSADDLWLFDLDTNNSNRIASPSDLVGRDIDLEDPFVSDDARRFYFKNKIDGTLWILDQALINNQ